MNIDDDLDLDNISRVSVETPKTHITNKVKIKLLTY